MLFNGSDLEYIEYNPITIGQFGEFLQKYFRGELVGRLSYAFLNYFSTIVPYDDVLLIISDKKAAQYICENFVIYTN